MEAVPRLARHVRDEMGRVIVGQEELKTQCLIVLLCEGHALLEGVPGMAKTLTVKTLSRLLGLDFQRVQCTSDLMPADIVGTNVVNLSTGTFQFHKGPVFTDLLLVDEVNRMPPRTQAALLECMEERQVTVDGVRHELSPFFTVFATQNPIEFEGTYPLPEAQLDRFLVKIRVPYPDAGGRSAAARNVQQDSTRAISSARDPAMPPVWLGEARQESAVNVEESLFGYIVKLVRQTREWPAVSLGASPRAAIERCASPRRGRDRRPRLRHSRRCEAGRAGAAPPLIVKPEADLEGVTADQSLDDVRRSRSRGDERAAAGAAARRSGGSAPGRAGVAFGPRTSVLLVGLIWLVPPSSICGSSGILAWDVLVLLAWVADLRRFPGLGARRPPHLARAAGALGTVDGPDHVDNHSKPRSAPLIDAADASPARAAHDGADVAPGAEAAAEYHITPRRGAAPSAASTSVIKPLGARGALGAAGLAQT